MPPVNRRPAYRQSPPLPPLWLAPERPIEVVPLAQFVLLSMLLHALAISLFGAPAGGSSEGRAMWGSLEVTILGPPREVPRLERDDSPRRAAPAPAPRPRPVPPEPRVEPRVEPPVEPPKAATPPVPSPPAPTVEPLAFPPLLDRLAPAERSVELPELKVPPPVEKPRPVPVEPLPAPMDTLTAPVLPRMIEAPAIPVPPIPATPLPAPMEPLAAPASPAMLETPALPTPTLPPPLPTPPVERAPIEAPAIPTPPVLRAPVEVPAIPVPRTESVVPRTTAPPTSPAPTDPGSALTTQPPSSAAPSQPPRSSAPLETERLREAPSPFRTPPRGAGQESPAYDPTAPSIDADAVRRRAGQLGREGSGNRALLPFPMPAPPDRKTQLETAIEKARKPDCRTAYADMGLLAVVPLIANEFGEGKCRW